MKTIYKIREAGREYCTTEGSNHYKSSNVIEPMDLIIAKGLAEDFCLANIIKYASRFKKTQNLEDLRKISDYSHILCGTKLIEKSHAIQRSIDDIAETNHVAYKLKHAQMDEKHATSVFTKEGRQSCQDALERARMDVHKWGVDND